MLVWAMLKNIRIQHLLTSYWSKVRTENYSINKHTFLEIVLGLISCPLSLDVGYVTFSEKYIFMKKSSKEVKGLWSMMEAATTCSKQAVSLFHCDTAAKNRMESVLIIDTWSDSFSWMALMLLVIDVIIRCCQMVIDGVGYIIMCIKRIHAVQRRGQ